MENKAHQLCSHVPSGQYQDGAYIEIPRGFKFNQSRKTHCLCLKKNLYGQKQAGIVWNKHLYKELIKIGFTQSTIDECVYYHRTTIMLCYVDDSMILINPKDKPIDNVIEELWKLN